MSLKTLLAAIAHAFKGGELGETLSRLKSSANSDYDRAINMAHSTLAAAEHEIGALAVTELERLETLIEAAKRRAQSLSEADVMLSNEHDQRLTSLLGKVG